MSGLVKHVGYIENSGKKCVLVFLRLPGDPNNALVIDVEALPERLHDPLMELLQSQEAQSETEFYTILSRRYIPDANRTFLQELHENGYLLKIPVNNVILLPRPNVRVRLSEVNAHLEQEGYFERRDRLAGIESQSQQETQTSQAAAEYVRSGSEDVRENVSENVDPTLQPSVQEIATAQMHPVEYAEGDPAAIKSRAPMIQDNMVAEKDEGRVAIARNLLAQVELLLEEARKLSLRAQSIAPELFAEPTPSTDTEAESQESAAATTNEEQAEISEESGRTSKKARKKK